MPLYEPENNFEPNPNEKKKELGKSILGAMVGGLGAYFIKKAKDKIIKEAEKELQKRAIEKGEFKQPQTNNDEWVKDDFEMWGDEDEVKSVSGKTVSSQPPTFLGKPTKPQPNFTPAEPQEYNSCVITIRNTSDLAEMNYTLFGYNRNAFAANYGNESWVEISSVNANQYNRLLNFTAHTPLWIKRMRFQSNDAENLSNTINVTKENASGSLQTQSISPSLNLSPYQQQNNIVDINKELIIDAGTIFTGKIKRGTEIVITIWYEISEAIEKAINVDPEKAQIEKTRNLVEGLLKTINTDDEEEDEGDEMAFEIIEDEPTEVVQISISEEPKLQCIQGIILQTKEERREYRQKRKQKRLEEKWLRNKEQKEYLNQFKAKPKDD